jgi:hypothetical protein
MSNRLNVIRNQPPPRLVYKTRSQARAAAPVYEVADAALSPMTLRWIRFDLRKAEAIAARRRDIVSLAACNAGILSIDKRLAATRRLRRG